MEHIRTTRTLDPGGHAHGIFVVNNRYSVHAVCIFFSLSITLFLYRLRLYFVRKTDNMSGLFTALQHPEYTVLSWVSTVQG